VETYNTRAKSNNLLTLRFSKHCIDCSFVCYLQEKDTGILAIEQPKDKLVNGIS